MTYDGKWMPSDDDRAEWEAAYGATEDDCPPRWFVPVVILAIGVIVVLVCL